MINPLLCLDMRKDIEPDKQKNSNSIKENLESISTTFYMSCFLRWKFRIFLRTKIFGANALKYSNLHNCSIVTKQHFRRDISAQMLLKQNGSFSTMLSNASFVPFDWWSGSQNLRGYWCIVTLKILTNMITILEVVTIFSPSPVFLWLTIKERLLNYREMQSSFCKYQIAFRTKKNYFCTSKRNRPNITLLINSKTNILNISHNHSHVIKYSKNIISNLSIRDC